MHVSQKPKDLLPIVAVPSKNLTISSNNKEKIKLKKMHLYSCNKHVLIMLIFLRILKISQQALCVRKKPYYEIENIFLWSNLHLVDTTPISVEIQKKILL